MLETYGKADANGITKMRVEIYNQDLNKWVEKKTQNTTFPREWDSKKIEWEVKRAWNSSKFEIIDPINKIWQGTSPSGIRIEGFMNNRTLAYPIYEGGELK